MTDWGFRVPGSGIGMRMDWRYRVLRVGFQGYGAEVRGLGLGIFGEAHTGSPIPWFRLFDATPYGS